MGGESSRERRKSSMGWMGIPALVALVSLEPGFSPTMRREVCLVMVSWGIPPFSSMSLKIASRVRVGCLPVTQMKSPESFPFLGGDLAS